MATQLFVQDRERSCSLRTQALPASTHVTRNAPVVEPVHHHTGDKFFVHSAQSRASRPCAEDVPEEAASSEKVQMVMLSRKEFPTFIV